MAEEVDKTQRVQQERVWVLAGKEGAAPVSPLDIEALVKSGCALCALHQEMPISPIQRISALPLSHAPSPILSPSLLRRVSRAAGCARRRL